MNSFQGSGLPLLTVWTFWSDLGVWDVIILIIIQFFRKQVFVFPLFETEYDYLEELDAEYLSFSVAGCNSTEIELQRFTMTDDNLLKTATEVV